MLHTPTYMAPLLTLRQGVPLSMVDDDARSMVRALISALTPSDRLEAEDQADVLRWVDSGSPLFRVNPPAEPPRHLAVYFALLDEDRREVMLVDHVKAGCWLLPGGHVDDGENPQTTVVREAAEELGIAARFHPRLGGGAPFFLTVTETRGAYSHTDVTLWFVLLGNRHERLEPDPREFRGVGWFGLGEPIQWNASTFDPQMHRFVAKLTVALEGSYAATDASSH